MIGSWTKPRVTAKPFAAENNIEIQYEPAILRHDADCKNIWIVFYKANSGSMCVNKVIVRGDDGEYKDLADQCVLVDIRQAVDELLRFLDL